MTWMERLHGGNIYQDFPRHEWDWDLNGWGSQSPVFEELIRQLKPQTIIEVGTWKGASAINMAEQLQKYKVEGEIICVDHWLPDVRDLVPRKWGMPQVYYQFIANVLASGLSSLIVPMPSESLAAAGILKEFGMVADLIYIDAAHDYFHAISDMNAYWKLLRSGGVMFGHDYSISWPGVVRAIAEFSDHMGLQIQVPAPDFWLLQKG